MHSSHGFSAQPRILPCPGSVAMCEGEPNETNPAAELGTAVHELVVPAILFGLKCDDFIGKTFNNHVVTQEMADAGQVYVAYIQRLKKERPGMKVYIEKKVCMSGISDKLNGTGDFIGIDGDTLISLDYKNGRGVVEVNPATTCTGAGVTLNGNGQVVGYALSAMDTFNLWGKIKKVITGIIQPNVEHKDGVIRTREYEMDELLQWYHAYGAGFHAADSPDGKLVAGTHCTYCRAAGFCGPRIRRTLKLAGLTSNVRKLDPDQIIAIMGETNTIKRTLDAVQKQAVIAARAGKPLKDYKLVKSIVRANCTDEDGFIKAATAEIAAKGGGDEMINKLHHKPKLVSMTAAKKIISNGLVNKFFTKPEAGVTLVPISDTRAAIMPDAVKPSVSGVFTEVK